MYRRFASLLGFCLLPLFASTALAAEDNKLFIYNWSDYIDPEVLTDFSAETGIEVHYDLMDSNEMLEAKLMAGHSGYDIVAPSLHVLKHLAKAGLLLPLQKDLLPNLKHLDEAKMAKIAESADPGNTYGIPYTEQSSALAYNVDKIKAIMGEDYEIDSWDVFFKPELLDKFASCGVTVLDSPSDMLCNTLLYLGLNPESQDRKDYAAAGQLLKQVVSKAAYIHSSQYLNDLASGEVCLSFAWAGDAMIANARSQEAGLGEIRYVLPKEGALMGYDMLAIPKDARNVENAHKFLDYIMRPEVIAKIANYILCANPNKDALPYIDPKLTSNSGLFFTNDVLQRLHIVIPPAKMNRIMTQEWNRVRMSADE